MRRASVHSSRWGASCTCSRHPAQRLRLKAMQQVRQLQNNGTKATQSLADVKAENAGLHEQIIQKQTEEEQEEKKVCMELRDTNTVQKIEIKKLQFERR